jgi:O-antigen/teichoic acid export membrane protein
MSASLVITAIGSIHASLMIKRLEFGKLLRVGVISTAGSGAMAVVLAIGGHGPWSLAWQVVTQALLSTTLLWVWSDWRPGGFSLGSLRRLVGFGRPLMASGLIDVAYNQAYSVVIGRQFSTAELGIYSRAQSVQQLPAGLLAGVVQRIALPVFSRCAVDPARLAHALVRSMRAVMFVNLPLMAGLAATASPMIQLVFGVQWLPAAPLLQVMCIIGALWPMHVLNLSALLAQGLSGLYLRLEVAKKSLGIAILLLTIPHGLFAVVCGQAAAAVLAYLVNSTPNRRLLSFGPAEQAKALWPELVATAGTTAMVVIGDRSIDLPLGARIACVVVLGSATYLAIMAWAAPSRFGFLRDYVRAVVPGASRVEGG